MSDRYGSYPPDEPIIGGPNPPASSRQGAGVGYAPPGDRLDYEDDGDDWEADAYDDEYADDESYPARYYEDDYYGAAPARQPIFYLFLAIAVLVGAGAIVLIFSLVRGGGGGDAAGTPGPAQFKVSVESPKNNGRVSVGAVTDVNVRATSTEPLARFELLVNDQLAGQVNATPPSSGDVYIAVLKTTFGRKGEYQVAVRVVAQSGAQAVSDTVRVTATEDVGAAPVRVTGKVAAAATLRSGPGAQFDAVGTLNAGQDVTIIGRTRDNAWLLLDIQAGRWAPAAAIDAVDPLELVPVREPTPTPVPTQRNTPAPAPTATPSVTSTPTTNPNAPDFAPTNAILIDGGRTLRVTVANISPNAYNGPLVVVAEGVGAEAPTRAFAAAIAGNGTATLDFALTAPITQARTASVRVDPENAVKEANEDNNSASFPLTPPVEAPSLVLTDPVVGPVLCA